MAFKYFLDEEIRRRVEQDGRIELTGQDVVSLHRTRSAHAVLLPVAVMFAVWSGVLQSFLATFPAFLAILIASIYCELCNMRDQGETPAATAMAIAKAAGGVVCGFVVFMAWYALAFVV